MTLPWQDSLTTFGQPVADMSDPIMTGAGDSWSPDNWLVQTVAQLPIPDVPSGQLPRVRNEPNTEAAPVAGAIGVGGSTGGLGTVVDAAMGMLGKPYVWGGTTADGVDCSGLLYYAFNAAGVKVPRYRAVDWGRMGALIQQEDARPGDIVYFDNANTDTDHVGIYLGSGKFIEAPQPGDRVKVSTLRGNAQIRRVAPESAYANMPTTASGNLVYNHQNQRFVGGQSFGPQNDPIDIVDSIGTDQFSEQLLGVNSGFELELPEVDDVAGTAAPAAATGGDQMQKFLDAVAGQESGGDYTVQNSIGAIGKYQVMYFNVGSWTQQALGRSMSPQEFRYNPQAQEAVARWRLGQYVKQYGWRGAAAAWYSGRANRADDYSHVGNGPSVGDYVDQVMARMGLG